MNKHTPEAIQNHSSPSPIDLAFVSLWTPNIVDWCDPFTNNKKRYCDAWNLGFHGYDNVLEHDRAPNWSKIIALQIHLGEHGWLFWADADTVVANFDFDLRSLCDPRYDLVVTHDLNGLNNGTFLIQNTPRSHEFLQRVWAKDIRDRYIEQTAMGEVMKEMPGLRVEVLPKRAMNSYWDDYEFGDFLFHVPGECNDFKRKLLRVIDKATLSGCTVTFLHKKHPSGGIINNSNVDSTFRRAGASHESEGALTLDRSLILPPLGRTIWQTYRSREQLPNASLPMLDSWRDRNPGWLARFCDDDEIRTLFREHLPLYLELFDSLPLGVMKADFWRYAVIYVHGGMYADIDTRCNVELNGWLAYGKSRELHVACENNHPYFCQWAFAAPAGHPVLLGALELIADRLQEDGGVDTNRPDYVHYYTGPALWTFAIQKYLGCSLAPNEIEECQEIWTGRGVKIYAEGDFTWGKISHANASYQWEGEGYSSWRSGKNLA